MKSVIIVIKLRRTNLDGAKDMYRIFIEKPQGRYMLAVFTLPIACLAYSSPSMVDTIHSSKMQVASTKLHGIMPHKIIPFAPKLDGKAILKLVIQAEVLRQIKLALGRVQWQTTVTTATSLQVV
jgi:hypothetical protein